MRAMLLVLAGCWSGTAAAPQEPADPPARARRGPVNRVFPLVEVRAIKRCVDAGGKLTVVLLFQDERTATWFQADLVHGPRDRVPRTFVDGTEARISSCFPHGCSIATLTLDELVPGKYARGHYKIAAKAGPSYEDAFEATWAGVPWADQPCARS